MVARIELDRKGTPLDERKYGRNVGLADQLAIMLYAERNMDWARFVSNVHPIRVS